MLAKIRYILPIRVLRQITLPCPLPEENSWAQDKTKSCTGAALPDKLLTWRPAGFRRATTSHLHEDNGIHTKSRDELPLPYLPLVPCRSSDL